MARGNSPRTGSRAGALCAIWFLCALAFLAASCGSDAPAETGSTRSMRTTTVEDLAPASLDLTEADGGGTFEIRVGGTVRLSLEADPSAGYSWELDDPDPEASVLEQLEQPVFTPDDPQAAEASGTLTYTFRAVDKGQMVVRLIYLDPEVDETPTKTFQIKLIVR